jgi:tRNA A-37 threonylcarbamoyl transferase component Bud32
MPTAESCLSPDELRTQLGRLQRGPDFEKLAAHLSSCPTCRNTAEALLSERSTRAGGPTAIASGVSHPLVAEWVRRLQSPSQASQATPAVASQQDATLAAPPVSEAATIACPSPMPLPSPVPELRQLGHYRIVSQLGMGGMGMVYLAEDMKLERRVALKVMRPELAAVRVHEQRFLQEARAAAKIENDHIVTIYQVDEENGIPFLAMQLLQGESMESWLQRGQQPTLGQAARLGREIAIGLAAAHARGLIHRDIKPANLWLEAPRGRVKILDFGLARFSTGDLNLTTAGVIVGTPAYMAPEQARGEKVSPGADLFSLGVVLFRLCTGRLPFKGGDAMSCMIAAATEAPLVARELNADIPVDLDALIAELLQKDPARRPESAAAVVDRLAGIENDLRRNRVAAGAASALLSVESARASREEQLPSLAPRRRRRALLATVIGAALGAGVALWLGTDAGTLEFHADDDGVRLVVAQDGKVVQTVEDLEGLPLRLRAGHYTLEAELKPGAPEGELELTTDQGTNDVRVDRGGKVIATVHRIARPAAPLPLNPPAKQPDHGWEPPALAVPFRSAAAPGPSADLRCLTFTADGSSLLVGYRTRLLTFDASTLRKTDSLSLHAGPPDPKGGLACMAVSKDARSLALRTSASKLVLWDLVARKERATLAQASNCAALEFSPDGTRLAVAEGKVVRFYEIESLKESASLTGHTDTITALAFASNGRKLAVGCLDGSLSLWDLATRKRDGIRQLSHAAEIVGLAFGPAGKRLVVGRPHDVKVVHLESTRDPTNLRSQGGAVAISRDSRWIALGDGRRLGLFDVPGAKRHSLPPEDAEVIIRVAFAPDGRSVATASKDGSVKLWDVASIVDGLSPLFDGRDLAGWKTYDCPADTFTAENGLIVAKGVAKGWLLTDEEYANFELRLEYRIGPAGDSGVAVRAAPQATALHAIEIQLIDDEHYKSSGKSASFRPEMQSGSLYDLQSPTMLNNNKLGEWNNLRLVVDGHHVLVEINGLRVVDYAISAADLAKRPELARASGRIGLQSQSGRVEFRNLLVKRLAPADKK